MLMADAQRPPPWLHWQYLDLFADAIPRALPGPHFSPEHRHSSSDDFAARFSPRAPPPPTAIRYGYGVGRARGGGGARGARAHFYLAYRNLRRRIRSELERCNPFLFCSLFIEWRNEQICKSAHAPRRKLPLVSRAAAKTRAQEEGSSTATGSRPLSLQARTHRGNQRPIQMPPSAQNSSLQNASPRDPTRSFMTTGPLRRCIRPPGSH